MAARRLRLAYAKARIVVIEKSATFGGLLGGVSYPDRDLYFDLGTHIFQETGDPSIDIFLQESLAPDNLILLPPDGGDLAGSVFEGKIQANSHFPDLRGHDKHGAVANSVRNHAEGESPVPNIERSMPLLAAAKLRFGSLYAETVLGPMLEHVYAYPASNLSAFAMALPGLTRIIIDDRASWMQQSKHPRYRSIVGYPEQRELPRHFRHARRSFYSRSSGSRALVDGVADWLTQAGVELLADTAIESIDLGTRSVVFSARGGGCRRLDAHGIVLSIGAIGAAHLLGLNLDPFGFDPPMPHWVVNLQLSQPCRSDLCYAYGLDVGCDWYRMTNYRAFSGNSQDCRLTLEVIGNRQISPTALPKLLVEQLRSCGVLQDSGIEFCDVRRLPAGFPSPTTRNMRAMGALAQSIQTMLPSRVLLGGIGSQPGLFFQNEIITDIYRRVGFIL